MIHTIQSMSAIELARRIELRAVHAPVAVWIGSEGELILLHDDQPLGRAMIKASSNGVLARAFVGVFRPPLVRDRIATILSEHVRRIGLPARWRS